MSGDVLVPRLRYRQNLRVRHRLAPSDSARIVSLPPSPASRASLPRLREGCLCRRPTEEWLLLWKKFAPPLPAIDVMGLTPMHLDRSRRRNPRSATRASSRRQRLRLLLHCESPRLAKQSPMRIGRQAQPGICALLYSRLLAGRMVSQGTVFSRCGEKKETAAGAQQYCLHPPARESDRMQSTHITP